MFDMFRDNVEAIGELNEVLESQGRLLDDGSRELTNVLFRVKWPKQEGAERAEATADKVVVDGMCERIRRAGADSLVTTVLSNESRISLRLSSKNLHIEATVTLYTTELSEMLPSAMERASSLMTDVADKLDCPVGECCYFVERLILRNNEEIKEFN